MIKKRIVEQVSFDWDILVTASHVIKSCSDVFYNVVVSEKDTVVAYSFDDDAVLTIRRCDGDSGLSGFSIYDGNESLTGVKWGERGLECIKTTFTDQTSYVELEVGDEVPFILVGESEETVFTALYVSQEYNNAVFYSDEINQVIHIINGGSADRYISNHLNISKD